MVTGRSGNACLTPPNGLVTTMDVARQHHHIGSGGRRLSRLELNVQIGMTWMVAMFFRQMVGTDQVVHENEPLSVM